jgi:CDGSH-type Zn-finger protein
MNGEKVIDLLWEVKEGKKHPNKAYTELCVLFDVVGRSEQLCRCGKPEEKAYSPCCSLTCWCEQF